VLACDVVPRVAPATVGAITASPAELPMINRMAGSDFRRRFSTVLQGSGFRARSCEQVRGAPRHLVDLRQKPHWVVRSRRPRPRVRARHTGIFLLARPWRRPGCGLPRPGSVQGCCWSEGVRRLTGSALPVSDFRGSCSDIGGFDVMYLTCRGPFRPSIDAARRAA